MAAKSVAMPANQIGRELAYGIHKCRNTGGEQNNRQNIKRGVRTLSDILNELYAAAATTMPPTSGTTNTALQPNNVHIRPLITGPNAAPA